MYYVSKWTFWHTWIKLVGGLVSLFIINNYIFAFVNLVSDVTRVYKYDNIGYSVWVSGGFN